MATQMALATSATTALKRKLSRRERRKGARAAGQHGREPQKPRPTRTRGSGIGIGCGMSNVERLSIIAPQVSTLDLKQAQPLAISR